MNAQFPACLVLLGAIAESFAAGPWWREVDRATLPPLNQPIEQVVDQFVARKLDAERVSPAPDTAPETLIRRLSLDLVGRVATRAEIDAFSRGSSPLELRQTVDRLIDSPAFDRYLAQELNWLLMDGQSTEFRSYLDAATKGRKSWDAIFADAIRGSTAGADRFVGSRVKDLDKLSNDVSVLFFGVNVSCAQCHDHPEVRSWNQDTYYGMKAFFGRTFDNGGFAGERPYGEISYKTVKGEEKAVRAHFLGGAPLEEPVAREPSAEDKKQEKLLLDDLRNRKLAPPEPAYSRKARLIEAALRDPEGYFARAVVNRTWHRLFGRGLVMPLDQMHGANRPSHPELLEWLALRLQADGFDLRGLIRGLVLSEAYRRDSRWNGSLPAPGLFAVASPRPLNPRQYAVSLKLVSLDPAFLGPEIRPHEVAKRIEGIEAGAGGLAFRFERPGDGFQFPVDEALYLSNSPEARDQFLNGGLARHLDALPEANGRIRTAYRAVLGRDADPEETGTVRQYLESRADRPQEAMRQVLWALLTGSEFRFNH
ncbi:MAG: DUF1553 domain-containing protein [Verrucomicrobia bacterium]|nr:DUF1553 domain-containing protein [Verrucomicrobiota bacterium]